MRASYATLATLALVLTALPAVSAHERYFVGDYLIILGEQNEPVYTYEFTNLDFFVRDNATGDPISGVEETVTATLIAPNGEEMSQPLAPQHGAEGEYEFEEDYILTMPGQYSVRLEGNIDGTDVTGEYLLPGPRGDMTEITFPHDDVQDLRELEGRIAALEAKLEAQNGGADEGGVGSPGFVWLPVLLSVGLGLAMRARRER